MTISASTLTQNAASGYGQVAPGASGATEHLDLAPDAIFWEATCHFGKMYEEIYVRWLEEPIELVETKL